MLILFISEGESINYNPIFSVEREKEGGGEGGREGKRSREYKYFKLTELCLARRPLPYTARVLREMNITMA